MADQEIGTEPAALLVIRGIDPIGRRLAGMDGDRQSARQRLLHVLVIGRFLALRQAAQIDAEVHEAIEGGPGGKILPFDAVDVGEVDRLVARHAVDMPVGITGAQQRLAMRAQLGIGMGGRARIVRPVVHGGDAGIGELGQPEHDAVVEVVGAVQRRGRVLGREIAEAAVADEIAAERAPHVVVGVDESGHHDHVGGIDHLGGGRREVGPDRLDPAIANEHVGARQRAERRVDGDHGPVPDEIGAARRRRGGGLRERLPDETGRASAEGGERRCAEIFCKGPAIEHDRLRFLSPVAS